MLYMCLRCDMLLLDPSFVFTVILASGSVSRLLPRPPDLSLGLTARTMGFRLHRGLRGPKVGRRAPPPRPQWSRSRASVCPHPGPGSPPHARQNPLSIPETAALGPPGWPPGLSTAPPSGRLVPARPPARPAPRPLLNSLFTFSPWSNCD